MKIGTFLESRKEYKREESLFYLVYATNSTRENFQMILLMPITLELLKVIDVKQIMGPLSKKKKNSNSTYEVTYTK